MTLDFSAVYSALAGVQAQADAQTQTAVQAATNPLNAQITGLTAQVSNLQADNADLAQQLAACEEANNNDPGVDTVFGVNSSNQGQLDTFTTLLQGPPQPEIIRYYYQPGEGIDYPAAGNRGDSIKIRSDQLLVVSGKNINMTVAQYVTAMKKAPTDKVLRVCGWHEPRKELLSGQFTKAQYNNLYVRLKQAAEQVGPHIVVTAILEGYDWVGKGETPEKYLPDDPDTYDEISGDFYWDGDIGGPVANMEHDLGLIVASGQKFDKPVSLSELGIGPKAGTQRNPSLTKLGQLIVQMGFVFGCYFLGDSDNSSPWKLLAADGSRDAWLAGIAA